MMTVYVDSLKLKYESCFFFLHGVSVYLSNYVVKYNATKKHYVCKCGDCVQVYFITILLVLYFV